MKFRIGTVTLAVALGSWSAAFSQTQEEFLDVIIPTQEQNSTLESELPLQGYQGYFDAPQVRPPIDGDIAEAFPVPSPAARADTGWLDALRLRVGLMPRRSIALGFASLGALFVGGWVAVSVIRRRARRAYRRAPRSSGGSRTRGLEAVVASVQMGRSRQAKRPGATDPMTGREWRRSP